MKRPSPRKSRLVNRERATRSKDDPRPGGGVSSADASGVLFPGDRRALRYARASFGWASSLLFCPPPSPLSPAPPRDGPAERRANMRRNRFLRELRLDPVPTPALRAHHLASGQHVHEGSDRQGGITCIAALDESFCSSLSTTRCKNLKVRDDAVIKVDVIHDN